MLLNTSLTSVELSYCVNITYRAYDTLFYKLPISALTGANTLDVASIGIDLGLLTYNTTMVSQAYGRAHDEVVVQNGTYADGIRADGSFGQHQGILYNGNYGID